ncbi:DUF1573 domain-containing protein [Marinilabiliaceae bacterium JC017]|nr:DUF1573 domain-containing protein [Marinilabiliaceae bacterium JC017]
MNIKITILIAVSCVMSLGWLAYSNFSLSASEIKVTKVEFGAVDLDFGVLERGVPRIGTFPFENTGDYPLVIYDVQASCGCTDVDWPRQPVNPGDSGEIEVSYDAKFPGRFVKSAKVYCNSVDGFEVLRIRGEVELGGQ